MHSLLMVVLIAATGMLFGDLLQTDRDSSGNIISGGSMDAFVMQVVDCFTEAYRHGIWTWNMGIVDTPGIWLLQFFANGIPQKMLQFEVTP